MSYLRSERTGEILLTPEQFHQLVDAFPSDGDESTARQLRLGPVPEDKTHGPYWEPKMDAYAKNSWYPEEWLGTRTEVIDGQIYVVPRVKILGFIFSMDWFDDPALWGTIETIVSSSQPTVEKESTGLGLAFGALAFAAGVAALRNKKKTSVSKKQTQAVKEEQEVSK